MTDVPAIFEDHATAYAAQRRQLIPPYDAFYATAVGALALAARPLRRILDLGAGTGILARAVRTAYPDAELTLLDGSPAMLAEARAVLGDDACYVEGDLADPLPPGPWDAVVSALAIHHLDDPGKRTLFARLHAELAPGAIFVDAEQVSGPTALFDDLYARWHEREAGARGATAEQWAAAVQRMRFDRWASVEHQLAWLREAGFADADCLFKDHRFAVLVARRAG
ncbi:MAG TPA: class I SAM-dependent methyltransferase [Solirubrobacteraceae bacterium]|jgi:tRNA (cmo5U34)-methyltransferase|nr:class I SAM-dependent methyltransferase [Solirubrobacteraceae bacterium]